MDITQSFPPFVVSNLIHQIRGKGELFINEFVLMKACNREKKPWISYIIEQGDGQTTRTIETDGKFFKRYD